MSRRSAITGALILFGIVSGAAGSLLGQAAQLWLGHEGETRRVVYAVDAARLLHRLSRQAAADGDARSREEWLALQLDRKLRSLAASPEVLILNSAAVLHGAEDITDLLLQPLAPSVVPARSTGLGERP